MTEETKVPFAQEVWDFFSNIDTEKFQKTLTMKGKTTREAQYLPWHRALLILKREYPQSYIQHNDDIHHPDGSMEVDLTVFVIGTDDVGKVLSCNARLPVMSGYSFSAVQNPDARDINDARQRCFVKAMAMGTGLALNIWAEDYRPVGTLSDPITEKQRMELDKLIEETGSNEEAFLEFAGVEKVEDITVEDLPRVKSMLEYKKSQQA